jgi:hypothetical protein
MNLNYGKLLVLNLILVPLLCYLTIEVLNFNPISSFVLVVFSVIGLFLNGIATFSPEDLNLKRDSTISSIFINIRNLMLLVCFILLLPINKIIILNNTSIVYQNNYKQKTFEIQAFYDNMWKTYNQKEDINKINKEVFIEVSKIIMENRKDGPNTAWKLVVENQNIPFNEFSSFYKDLSLFIESQRQSYLNLEKERQKLVFDNNIMLEIFPNNIYKFFTKAKPIVYTYEFNNRN